MIKARALWHESGEKSVIKDEAVKEPAEGWCEISTLFSGISPGTERLVARGLVPGTVREDMKCPYMGGQFPFPVKYGYSVVGEIVGGNKDLLGKVVHVLHPHQDRCVVREDDISVLPDGIPPGRAVLTSNMETAVNAIWDSRVSIGDEVLVVGFGAIGSLVARLLTLIGETQPVVAEIDPEKLDLARTMGFTAVSPDEVGTDFDVSFHATGTGEGLQLAIDTTGFEGVTVELSWYGSRSVELRLGESFHSQRKRIVSSQVSVIPAHRQRWDIRRRKQLVFSLLRKKEFDNHITDSVPFADLPELFRDLRKEPKAVLGYSVRYQGRKEV